MSDLSDREIERFLDAVDADHDVLERFASRAIAEVKRRRAAERSAEAARAAAPKTVTLGEVFLAEVIDGSTHTPGGRALCIDWCGKCRLEKLLETLRSQP